jgi:hypothetical protein
MESYLVLRIRSNIKMPVLSKAIYSINATPIKILMKFLPRTRENSKYLSKTTKDPYSQRNFDKKEEKLEIYHLVSKYTTERTQNGNWGIDADCVSSVNQEPY